MKNIMKELRQMTFKTFWARIIQSDDCSISRASSPAAAVNKVQMEILGTTQGLWKLQSVS